MGKTQYKKCYEMLMNYTDAEITFDELMLLIRKNIGNDKYRVLQPCFDLMLSTKLIEEIEHGKFRILCRQAIQENIL